ncbi:MAG: hypothetical protein MK172_11080, partial [Verrucomicrobiales bacterium]|nr:hypothetical protein [Verrucomicrobiales bacterium]
LANALGNVEGEVLPDLLNEMFGIQAEQETTVKPKKKSAKKKVIVKRTRKKILESYALTESPGFVVKNHDEAAGKPDRVIIKAAYAPDMGNAFNNYHPSDFDFAEGKGIEVVTEGCRVLSREHNRVKLEVDDKTFKATFKGFDSNRDLKIDFKADND